MTALEIEPLMSLSSVRYTYGKSKNVYFPGKSPEILEVLLAVQKWLRLMLGSRLAKAHRVDAKVFAIKRLFFRDPHTDLNPRNVIGP